MLAQQTFTIPFDRFSVLYLGPWAVFPIVFFTPFLILLRMLRSSAPYGIALIIVGLISSTTPLVVFAPSLEDVPEAVAEAFPWLSAVVLIVAAANCANACKSLAKRARSLRIHLRVLAVWQTVGSARGCGGASETEAERWKRGSRRSVSSFFTRCEKRASPTRPRGGPAARHQPYRAMCARMNAWSNAISLRWA